MIVRNENANNFQEVNKLLKELNTAITLMFKLDDIYYREHIFNSSVDFGEVKFNEIGNYLEHVRSLLYGDMLIDWKELSKEMDLLCKEEKKEYREHLSIAISEWLSVNGITFKAKMESMGIKNADNIPELLNVYKRLRHDARKKLDEWLQKDLRFYNIDEICDIDG